MNQLTPLVSGKNRAYPLSLAGFFFLCGAFILSPNSPASAADPVPLYHFQFTDGSLASSGSLSTELETKRLSSMEFSEDAELKKPSVKLLGRTKESRLLLLPDSDKIPLDQPDGGMTIAMWVRWDGDATAEGKTEFLVGRTSDDGTLGWSLLLVDRKLELVISQTPEGPDERVVKRLKCDYQLTPGQWTHVALTISNNSGEIGFYDNGKEAKMHHTPPGVVTTADDNFLSFGDNEHGQMPLTGALADIRIYPEVVEPGVIWNISQDRGGPSATSPRN
jgi:hypothetical protein